VQNDDKKFFKPAGIAGLDSCYLILNSSSWSSLVCTKEGQHIAKKNLNTSAFDLPPSLEGGLHGSSRAWSLIGATSTGKMSGGEEKFSGIDSLSPSPKPK